LGMTKENWTNYIKSLKKIRDWVAHSNTEELTKNPFASIVTILNQTAEIIKKLNSF